MARGRTRCSRPAWFGPTQRYTKRFVGPAIGRSVREYSPSRSPTCRESGPSRVWRPVEGGATAGTSSSGRVCGVSWGRSGDPVADTWQRLDDRVAELAPQAAHRDGDGVGERVGVLVPDLREGSIGEDGPTLDVRLLGLVVALTIIVVVAAPYAAAPRLARRPPWSGPDRPPLRDHCGPATARRGVRVAPATHPGRRLRRPADVSGLPPGDRPLRAVHRVLSTPLVGRPRSGQCLRRRPVERRQSTYRRAVHRGNITVPVDKRIRTYLWMSD